MSSVRPKPLALAATLILVLSLTATHAAAFSIENKSPFEAYVIVKDEDFNVIDRFIVPPATVQNYAPAEKVEGLLNIESYLRDPSDPTGTPTFFHMVKPRDKLCIPQAACEKATKPKKKKGGGILDIFKIF